MVFRTEKCTGVVSVDFFSHSKVLTRSFMAHREELSDASKVKHLGEMFNITMTEAKSALEACQFDLDRSVQLLTSRQAAVPSSHYIARETAAGGASPESASRTSGDGAVAVSVVDQATGTEHNPIDLTREGSDQDLQKALALSIQEMQQGSTTGATGGGGGISIEDQELSRALEASIRDNHANMSRLGIPVPSTFVDPLNPHERKRDGNTPVGLKNIGNTCWFSAVIQSLFSVPVFTHLILNYHPPPLPTGTTEYPNCVSFVLELQKLFSLLLHSERKYINPQPAIQTLKEAFTKDQSHAGAQQDVSEFTHKLLEWIEDAFDLSLSREQSNPIIALFNGQCKTEGILNNQEFVNESQFGAFPVQVQGHAHLHDSLDAATCSAEMQQETWFTHIPPILVLELARFKYNQKSGQAEKVHDKLNFDLKIHVDRYLEKNKAETRQRRSEVVKLKARLSELGERLTSYTNYDQKPVSIIEVLGMTLKFIHEQSWSEEREEGESAEKRPRTSLYPLPRFISSQELGTMERCVDRWTKELAQDIEDLQESISATQTTLDAVYSDRLMKHTPYHLHAVLVHQGQASGGHYWAYVRRKQNISSNQEGVGRSHDPSHDVSHDSPQSVEVVLDSQSEDEGGSSNDITAPQTGQTSLKPQDTLCETGQTCLTTNHPTTSTETPPSTTTTTTHDSVTRTTSQQTSIEGSQTGSAGCRSEGMEVEGSTAAATAPPPAVAAGGSGGGDGSEGDVWLKFNDVSVSQVSWSEVQRESEGDYQRNTSAYCLVYVNEMLHEQWKRNDPLPTLSEELGEYVEKDNIAFQVEISDYDTKQRNAIETARHISSSQTVALPSGGHPTSPASVEAYSTMGIGAPSDAARPVGPSHVERSPEQMQVDSPPLPPVDPQLSVELKQLADGTTNRLSNLFQGIAIEPRTAHIVTYAHGSGASRELIRVLVLEEVIAAAEKSSRENVGMLARVELMSLLRMKGTQEKLNELRTCFQLFCTVCWHFTKAMKAIKDERWFDVMNESIYAYMVHLVLCRMCPSETFSLMPIHIALLIQLRRQSLQKASDVTYSLFEQGEVVSALKLANAHLVPSLGAFAMSICPGDEDVLEKVREEWCQCLVHPGLTEDQQDQLGDLLTRMFEETSKSSRIPDITNLSESFDHHNLTLGFSNQIVHLLPS